MEEWIGPFASQDMANLPPRLTLFATEAFKVHVPSAFGHQPRFHQPKGLWGEEVQTAVQVNRVNRPSIRSSE